MFLYYYSYQRYHNFTICFLYTRNRSEINLTPSLLFIFFFLPLGFIFFKIHQVFAVPFRDFFRNIFSFLFTVTLPSFSLSTLFRSNPIILRNHLYGNIFLCHELITVFSSIFCLTSYIYMPSSQDRGKFRKSISQVIDKEPRIF